MRFHGKRLGADAGAAAEGLQAWCVVDRRGRVSGRDGRSRDWSRRLRQRLLLFGGRLGESCDATCDGLGVDIEFRSCRRLFREVLCLVQGARARVLVEPVL